MEAIQAAKTILPGLIVTAWSRYRVGTLSTRSNWTNSDCVPFDSVGHVAHLDVAVSILREHKLKPGLVFDQSGLTTTRTLVAWLSPNYLSDGFHYGNVMFDFNFRKLVEGKLELLAAVRKTRC